MHPAGVPEGGVAGLLKPTRPRKSMIRQHLALLQLCLRSLFTVRIRGHPKDHLYQICGLCKHSCSCRCYPPSRAIVIPATRACMLCVSIPNWPTLHGCTICAIKAPFEPHRYQSSAGSPFSPNTTRPLANAFVLNLLIVWAGRHSVV